MPSFKPELRLRAKYRLVSNAWSNQMSSNITSVPVQFVFRANPYRACGLISSFKNIAATLNLVLKGYHDFHEETEQIYPKIIVICCVSK